MVQESGGYGALTLYRLTSNRWRMSFPPGELRLEPHLDIPMPSSRLRLQLLIKFRMVSHMRAHFVPVEHGRFVWPMMPRQLCRCIICSTHAMGDERHNVLDSPHFEFAHIRRQSRSLFQDADGALRTFTWHPNQKAVCHCLAAILILADDSSISS